MFDFGSMTTLFSINYHMENINAKCRLKQEKHSYRLHSIKLTQFFFISIFIYLYLCMIYVCKQI